MKIFLPSARLFESYSVQTILSPALLFQSSSLPDPLDYSNRLHPRGGQEKEEERAGKWEGEKGEVREEGEEIEEKGEGER